MGNYCVEFFSNWYLYVVMTFTISSTSYLIFKTSSIFIKSLSTNISAKIVFHRFLLQLYNFAFRSRSERALQTAR